MRLDAVVCLCDSPRLLRALVAPPPPPKNLESKIEGRAESSGDREVEISWRDTEEADIKSSTALVMSQLALSDRVLLNKADLITREEVSAPPSFDTWCAWVSVVPSKTSTCIQQNPLNVTSVRRRAGRSVDVV